MLKENSRRSESVLSATQHSPYTYTTLPSHPYSLSQECTPRQKQTREVKKNPLTAQVASANVSTLQTESNNNTTNKSESNLHNTKVFANTLNAKETTVQTCNSTTLSLKSCQTINITKNNINSEKGNSTTFNNNYEYDKSNVYSTPNTTALPIRNYIDNNSNTLNLNLPKDNAISPYSKTVARTSHLPILQNLYNTRHNNNYSNASNSVKTALSTSLPVNKLTQTSESKMKRQPLTSRSLTASHNAKAELMKTSSTSKLSNKFKDKCACGDNKNYYHHNNHNKIVRYKTDLNKQVIHFMFHQLPHVQELVDDEADNVSSSSTTNNNYTNANDNLGNNYIYNNNDNINNNNNWHMYWMSVGHVHNIFAGTEYRLNEVQIINHFPNHSELTRKDLMYKNIKAYLRAQESSFNDKQLREPLYVVNALSWRVSALLAQCDGHERNRLINLLHNKWKLYKECAELQKLHNCNNIFNSGNEENVSNAAFTNNDDNNILDVSQDEYRIFSFAESVPMTYNIPNDINMFIEEFKRQPKSIWIVKPTSRCQGRGIFLINRIQQLMKWMRYKEKVNASLDSISECASMTRDDKQVSAVYTRTQEKITTTGKKTKRAKRSSKSRRHHKTSNITTTSPNKNKNNRMKCVNSTHQTKQGMLKYNEQSTNDCTLSTNDINQNENIKEGSLLATGMSLTDNNTSAHNKVDHGVYSGTFIVSKYIHKPLLIGNKKFDLRLYVLVTSFNPLVAYLHEDGFARFCATPYSPHSLRDSDLASHLTNVALQKGEENYNAEHGGKLTWQNVLLYIHGHYGEYVAQGLMHNVEFLIYHSLRAVSKVMHNDKHCFELYGYDILLDDQVQPHLIEVNASPSLSTTTDSDRWLKQKVLSDTLRVVVPPNYPASDSMPYAEYRLRTDLTTQLLTGFKLLQM